MTAGDASGDIDSETALQTRSALLRHLARAGYIDRGDACSSFASTTPRMPAPDAALANAELEIDQRPGLRNRVVRL